MKPKDGATVAMWSSGVEVPQFDPLKHNLSTDVCIVGAGIAGLTCAYLLARQGRKVVVIDSGPIGDGQTGRTSAHLASAVDDRFTELESALGKEASRLQYESHSAGIDLIEKISTDEKIDCDFLRVDGFLFLAPDQDSKDLREELAAAQRAGFNDAEMLEKSPLEKWPGPCIRFPRQAQFQPMKYLAGLAKVCARDGVKIYCGSMVNDVQGGQKPGDGCTVKTDAGKEVTAQNVIVATNTPTPINDWFGIYTKQASYRSYVVGLTIPKGSVPPGLYWDDDDPYHYVRVAADENDHDLDILLVGGADEKTGQLDRNATPFVALRQFAEKHFGEVGEVAWRWSGQVQEPDDYAAYIGAIREHVYVVTGDSGMGLTHASLGAMLISDLIAGKPNPWKDLYDPLRKPTGALGGFVSENINVAKQYLDFITPGEVKTADEIRPGEGAVIREGFSKIAVYRDGRGQISRCSAVCTHLGCVVQWNHIEKTWDCPCHGSRFGPKGQVIIGPAVTPRTPIEEKLRKT